MKSLKMFGREILSWGIENTKIKNTVKQALSTDSSQSNVSSLTLEMMRRIALREPLIYKAIEKKNKDTFRNWFILDNKIEDTKISKRILNIILDFEEFSNIKHKMAIAGICASVYGTGFIEVIYNEPKNTEPHMPVNDKARPVDLRVLNSEFIKEKKKRTDRDNTVYWVYKEPNTTNEIFIHPDRLIDIATDRLPFSPFGISKIHILKNILESKLNSDVAAGETLAWFSTGILDMTIQSMDGEQEKAMLALFNEHPHFYVHDEDYVLDIKNPTRIDPKPFYDYFYANIAAAMEMPVSLLIGKGEGSVEVGMSDYYHDVENIQEVIFTPIIKKLYEQLLKSYGFNWNYSIKWNPIFVDELAEGKIMQVRSYSAVNARNSGIIDVSEARDILVNGVVDLDINKVPKPPEMPGAKTDQPNIEPQPSVKKPTAKIQSVVTPLNPMSKKMIEECAKRERELGKEILQEQEKIFKKRVND